MAPDRLRHSGHPDPMAPRSSGLQPLEARQLLAGHGLRSDFGPSMLNPTDAFLARDVTVTSAKPLASAAPFAPGPPDPFVARGTVANPQVLFVRGGLNTGGFLEGNTSDDDEQLSSLFNNATNGGNHGWGQLADTLEAEGYTLTEIREGDVVGNQPVDFSAMDLSIYDAIVMGSNNAVYAADDIDALEAYVQTGGAALFISDANFGENWADAPDSDQQFLDRFGWTVNQDQGTYSLFRNSGDFITPDHPILEGINQFDGEGVSPLVIPVNDLPGVNSTILARAKNTTRNNNGDPGSSRSVTARDASLAIATVGDGRIAGHYDRNTFFNNNGAGTNINRFDNQALAVNLFSWLVNGEVDPPLEGDFDQSGDLTIADLEMLCAEVGEPLTAANAMFDLDNTGNIAAGDVVTWLSLIGSARGDANLDGAVDLLDLDALGSNFNGSGTWSQGDFDCNGTVDLLDLNILGQFWGSGVSITAPISATSNGVSSATPFATNASSGRAIGAASRADLLNPAGDDRPTELSNSEPTDFIRG